MRRSFLLAPLLSVSTLAVAQQGTLVGKVLDKKTGEAVIGATVIVTGTTQAAPVGVDGSYELRLAPGIYGITIQNLGYKPVNFTGIEIKAGQKTTLDSPLEENVQALKEVTITGQKATGTEIALIQDLRKSEVVVSGMSNDQIVKTLDRDAAEVVKRIPGVTVQNNNFIVIRGLAERYNTVLLNDALTPSAEVDTRSFSFDILPSSVIDRVLIFKSGSPELPGEFGGGVVKVYTKNSVLENSTSLSVSGWARSTNTFKGGYLVSDQTPAQLLGFGGEQRQMPSQLDGLQPGVQSNAEQTLAVRNQLRNEFMPRLIRSRPDMRFSLGLNRKYEIGSAYVSNVTSISYSNTQEQNTSERQRFNEYRPGFLDPKFSYVDTRSLSAVRLGVIHNYQVRLNSAHVLEFRNFFNQYGTDEVVNRQGLNFETGTGPEAQQRNDYALHYQSRSIYSGQLGGRHDLGQRGLSTLTWAAGYNYVHRNEPDYRQNQQTRFNTPDTPETPNPFVVTVDIVPQTSSRFYSKLDENTYMASGQFERRFFGRDTLSANQYKLRVGFYAEEKQRDYNSRYFNYVRPRQGFNEEIGRLPLSSIFDPANINPNGGFLIREGTKETDRYKGENRLLAGYLSAVAPLTEKLNLSGGVRVEYNRKYLASGETESLSAVKKPYEEIRTFVLPSLNATYNLSEKHLLRAGSSVSVNRPEFREVADYTYYDFSTNFFIEGNDSLRTARIYNADLRYEFYPTRSEMISVGVFYKKFTDAIEQVTRSSGNVTLSYQNADQAYDLGVELEARKSLLGVVSSPVLQRFSFVLNAALIYSRVQFDMTDDRNKDFALNNRPLQGQSPYVVNLGTFYQDDEHRWQISAQYNVIGPRITFVGDQRQNFSVFELPRHVVDLAVTKGFGPHLEVRAGVQNLLNQQVEQYYDLDRNGKITGFEHDAVFARYRRGLYSTLGLTYRF